jgi:hypothetical protein
MKRFLTSRVFAAVLVLAGAGGLFVVFWLLPYLGRDYDGEWLGQHSLQARWEHTQNRIRRFGWQHDDFRDVGQYGNKQWAEWIVERLTEDGNPGDCGAGHRLQALEHITNYAPATERKPWKELLPLWEAWWKENRSKAQDEWIVEGFDRVGMRIHNPPKEEDWPVLLTVLAPADRKTEPVKGDHRRDLDYLYYNAFRCLRDSGFNSVKYALESPITPEIKAGLEAYHRRETQRDFFSERPGGLFKKGTSNRSYGFASRFLRPAFRWGWGSASAVVLLAGLWLWRRRTGMFSRR